MSTIRLTTIFTRPKNVSNVIYPGCSDYFASQGRDPYSYENIFEPLEVTSIIQNDEEYTQETLIGNFSSVEEFETWVTTHKLPDDVLKDMKEGMEEYDRTYNIKYDLSLIKVDEDGTVTPYITDHILPGFYR